MSNLYYIESDHSKENKLMKYASKYEVINKKGQYICIINEKAFKEGVIDSYHILDKTLVFRNCVLSNVTIKLIEKVEKIFFDNCIIENVNVENKKPISASFISSQINGDLQFNNSIKKYENVMCFEDISLTIKKNGSKISFENMFLDNLNIHIFHLFESIFINNCTHFNFYSSYITPDNNIMIYRSQFHLILNSKKFLHFKNNVSFVNNNIVKCQFDGRFKSFLEENVEKNIDYNNFNWLFKIERVKYIVNFSRGQLSFNNFLAYFITKVYVEIVYNIHINYDDKIQIGCIDKDLEGWDYFFSNECTEAFETPRSHPLFQIIKKNYQIFKIKNNL